MKPRRITGEIDSVLKVRIDTIQQRIDLIDDKYKTDAEYRLAYNAVRNALVKQKENLIEAIKLVLSL